VVRASQPPASCGSLPAVSLLAELDALYTEHDRCGDLDPAWMGRSSGSRATGGPAWPAAWTMMTATPTVELSIAEPIRRGVTMSIRHAAHLVIVLSLLAAALTSCKHYWGKPGATAEQFNRDSTECAKEASSTSTVGYVRSENIYKGCMRARGWARDQKMDPPGEGWFRGIENWD
jgi:hypothetical protein